jgi:hypothetical protein
MAFEGSSVQRVKYAPRLAAARISKNLAAKADVTRVGRAPLNTCAQG